MATVTAVACSVAEVSLWQSRRRNAAQLTCSIADNRNQNETNKLLGYASSFHDIVDTTNHKLGIEGDKDCCDGQSDESAGDSQRRRFLLIILVVNEVGLIDLATS